eukprot:Opistho-1_new@14713
MAPRSCLTRLAVPAVALALFVGASLSAVDVSTVRQVIDTKRDTVFSCIGSDQFCIRYAIGKSWDAIPYPGTILGVETSSGALYAQGSAGKLKLLLGTATWVASSEPEYGDVSQSASFRAAATVPMYSALI